MLTRTAVRAVRAARPVQSRSKFTLPALPYAYDALEPTISKEIMEIHHSKHHQTYVTNLNAANESLAAAQVRRCRVPRCAARRSPLPAPPSPDRPRATSAPSSRSGRPSSSTAAGT